MNIDNLLGTSAIPTLMDMRDCAEEFLIDREESCPKEVRGQLRLCLGGQLVEWDNLTHLVFAKKDDCGPILKQICSGVMAAFAAHGFSGGITNDRASASKMSLIMLREAGVKSPDGYSWPDKNDDPPIHDKFIEVDIADIVMPDEQVIPGDGVLPVAAKPKKQ